jgi:ABC-type antimicrobial peptide transport system permease subunit
VVNFEAKDNYSAGTTVEMWNSTTYAIENYVKYSDKYGNFNRFKLVFGAGNAKSSGFDNKSNSLNSSKKFYKIETSEINENSVMLDYRENAFKFYKDSRQQVSYTGQLHFVSETEDIIDANDYRAFYDDDVVKSIDSSMDIIILVVMIFLAISVIVAYVSFMRNRVSEYCLYSSIGYSKKSIYAMMMREMIIIFAAGIIIGAMIAGVIVIFLNKTAVEPMGLIGKLVDLNQISKIMTAIICIIGLLQIPAVMTINSIKTIDMIED